MYRILPQDRYLLKNLKNVSVDQERFNLGVCKWKVQRNFRHVLKDQRKWKLRPPHVGVPQGEAGRIPHECDQMELHQVRC